MWFRGFFPQPEKMVPEMSADRLVCRISLIDTPGIAGLWGEGHWIRVNTYLNMPGKALSL